MKRLTLGLVLAAAALAGAIWLPWSDKTVDAPTKSSKPPVVNGPAASQPGAGAYLDYDPNIIAKTPGTKLLFFHAPWCPQCRALEADIKSRGVPSGVAIIKVDYDSHQNLRQKYGVTIQTTLVKVDDKGGLVKKYVAYDEPSLDALKRNLL